MNNFRKYGSTPYKVAVIHGGPGAIGEMAPVAQELSLQFGVLEPFQTEMTLEGQVAELRDVIKEQADPPVCLIGFSWGAWLSYLLTAKYPALVKKLILVGSGPYEPRYVEHIQATRLSRLNKKERVEYETILAALNNPKAKDKAERFARLGQLAGKTDQYDPIPTLPPEPGDNQAKQAFKKSNKYHEVLKEAQVMRQDGSLLEFARNIQIPVVALHGDYDPHPIAGVHEPLSAALKDFKMIEIEHCGHKPWSERQAQDKFYELLKAELHVA